MSSSSGVRWIAPLLGEDVVAVAQCIAIDAAAFPYASATFALHSPQPYAWVARDPGHLRVIGFVATHARLGVMHVDGLAVDLMRRRQGIARELLREVIDISRTRGMRAIALHVSVANRAAIALYVSEGFVFKGRLRAFYPAAAFQGETDAYALVLAL